MALKITFLVLTTLLTACADLPAGLVGGINPEIQPYVNYFEKEFGVSVRYGVQLVTMPEHAGLCFNYPTGGRFIKINVDYWRRSDDSQREELIFHELGHCSLGLEHLDAFVEFSDVPGIKWPSSIMNHVAFSPMEGATYLSHRNYYLNQLREMVYNRKGK